MNENEIYEQLKNAVLNIDEESSKAAVEAGLHEGLDPMSMIENGFAKGMVIVGDEFEAGRRFLPQLMMSAALMTESIEQLKESIEGEVTQETQGTIVIGTVEGDVHDIGKNIVKIFLGGNGFKLYDLGRDVLLHKFIEKAEEVNADIISTSALMTSTMQSQATLEEMLKEKGLKGKIKTMIGGAPITERWMKKIGADGCAENASEAVKVARQLMEQ
ncbi:B12-binding domain-containing protein [Methanococcoides sp. LMO-2]|uniref:B12-binding domain-containing protein n=1 Tax=Methanococcoides cohabitans TaxID=3136559 RepID=A0ABU9KTB8_9EURY